MDDDDAIPPGQCRERQTDRDREESRDAAEVNDRPVGVLCAALVRVTRSCARGIQPRRVPEGVNHDAISHSLKALRFVILGLAGVHFACCCCMLVCVSVSLGVRV